MMSHLMARTSGLLLGATRTTQGLSHMAWAAQMVRNYPLLPIKMQPRARQTPLAIPSSMIAITATPTSMRCLRRVQTSSRLRLPAISPLQTPPLL
ncbi:hypothetical protein BKA58DRAFT_386439, partial [Alternaria rosae]|uniref:uncharacterized protein n=1 Tax=Alternaria rosae TaxID=1187941 RepID=UPI001E8E135A